MNIYGEKVILRSITINDSALLLKIINDPEIEKMLGGFSFPVSMEEQQKWIIDQYENNKVLRCIIAKKDEEITGVGTIILSDIDMKNGTAQIHIKMDRESGQMRGYGTDALNTIVKYAFNEMRINCVFAEVLAYNIASQKLFEKCGFVKDGVLRSRIFKNGNYIDILSYSILNEDD